MTPNICILYCEYLDRRRIDQQVITIYEDNIIFKLNMLQFRNCENFVISNIDNSQTDYAKCYEDWCNIDYSQKLIFSTEKNQYVLKAEFIEHKIFSSKIKVYDIDKFNKINSEETIIYVMACDKSEYMKVHNIKIIENQKEYIMVENLNRT
ncbi:MAG: hypothetical protein J6V90_11115 [Treponema sp.]|nr:hypothetical protein [Treponema sp.]